MFFFSECCLKYAENYVITVFLIVMQAEFLGTFSVYSYRRSYWQNLHYRKPTKKNLTQTQNKHQILLFVKTSHYVCHGFSLGLIDKSLERSIISRGRDLIILLLTLFQLLILNSEWCFGLMK